MLQEDIITQRVKLNLKNSMLKSSLYDYSDAYIPVKRRITITGRKADERNRGVIFQNCAPFTTSTTEINNTKIDNAKDLDVII